MTNIGTPHPGVGVANAIVSEDDHHPIVVFLALVSRS